MAELVPASPEMRRFKLQQTANAGARWFFWIAGLSAVNSLLWWLEARWSFSIGLGITQVIDGFATRFGSAGVAIALALDLTVVIWFVVIGVLALRHQLAYKVGIVLYGLDGLLLFAFRDVLGAGFHVFALIFIFNGLSAARTLAAEPAPAIDPPGTDVGQPTSGGAAIEPVPLPSNEYFEFD